MNASKIVTERDYPPVGGSFACINIGARLSLNNRERGMS